MSAPQISVIIRARDEAGSIARCLELVAGQSVADERLETIVVDSGSRDETVEIARACGVRVIEIPPRAFTFGRALNLGAANARGELLVSLSAHAFPRDAQWLERLTAPFSDPAVACACGQLYEPHGDPLTGRVEQDAELARLHPGWGYSNAAGAFRAELWRRRPFRPELPGCEDLEWSCYWLRQGYRCVLDPVLVVEHDHTHDPLPSIYRRARREAEGLGMFLNGGSCSRGPRSDSPRSLPSDSPRSLLSDSPRSLLSDWWSDTRFYSSPLRARLSHRRAARLLGARAGRRRARRRTGASA